MHLPDNTSRLHVIYVTVPNTENTEMLCNNNIQILIKLAYEIKHKLHMEKVTIAPTVLLATGLVTASRAVCKCLNAKKASPTTSKGQHCLKQAIQSANFSVLKQN